jgi:hypothetical protein
MSTGFTAAGEGRPGMGHIIQGEREPQKREAEVGSPAGGSPKADRAKAKAAKGVGVRRARYVLCTAIGTNQAPIRSSAAPTAARGPVLPLALCIVTVYT